MTTNDGGVMERRTFLGAMAAAAVAAGAGTARARTRAAPIRTDAFAWSELAEGKVWATGGTTTGGNVMLVASDGRAAVVDAKFAGYGPLLRQEAEGRAGCAVSTFINTHHHGDHTGGNFAFAGGPTMLAHAAAARRIAESAEAYRRQVEGAAGAVERLGDDVSRAAGRTAWEAAAGRAAADTAGPWTPTATFNAYPMRHREGRLDLDI
jgi:glyoxylase-like metal-dependent hydrolase (beta-lactamase superfamily II)